MLQDVVSTGNVGTIYGVLPEDTIYEPVDLDFPLMYLHETRPKNLRIDKLQSVLSKLEVRTTNSLDFIRSYFGQYYTEIRNLLDLGSSYMTKFRLYSFVFFFKDTKEAIGFISLNLPREKSVKVSAFLDIWVRPEFRGKV